MTNIKDSEYVDVLKGIYNSIPAKTEDEDGYEVNRVFHAVMLYWLFGSAGKIKTVKFSKHAYFPLVSQTNWSSWGNSSAQISCAPFFENTEHGLILKSKLINKFTANGFKVSTNDVNVLEVSLPDTD